MKKCAKARSFMLVLLISTTFLFALPTGACKRGMKKMDEYHQELWTAEADENLDRINHALIRQWKSAENKADFEFPSAGPTPSKVPCGKRPQEPDGDLWNTPGWQKLGFEMTKPFRYQYQVLSHGKGRNARFTIRAHGDLDCDGVWSTYELWGAIDEKGNVHNFDGKKFDEETAAE